MAKRSTDIKFTLCTASSFAECAPQTSKTRDWLAHFEIFDVQTMLVEPCQWCLGTLCLCFWAICEFEPIHDATNSGYQRCEACGAHQSSKLGESSILWNATVDGILRMIYKTDNLSTTKFECHFVNWSKCNWCSLFTSPCSFLISAVLTPRWLDTWLQVVANFNSEMSQIGNSEMSPTSAGSVKKNSTLAVANLQVALKPSVWLAVHSGSFSGAPNEAFGGPTILQPRSGLRDADHFTVFLLFGSVQGGLACPPRHQDQWCHKWIYHENHDHDHGHHHKFKRRTQDNTSSSEWPT